MTVARSVRVREQRAKYNPNEIFSLTNRARSLALRASYRKRKLADRSPDSDGLAIVSGRTDFISSGGTTTMQRTLKLLALGICASAFAAAPALAQSAKN
jgi:hypothetical protein